MLSPYITSPFLCVQPQHVNLGTVPQTQTNLLARYLKSNPNQILPKILLLKKGSRVPPRAFYSFILES